MTAPSARADGFSGKPGYRQALCPKAQSEQGQPKIRPKASSYRRSRDCLLTATSFASIALHSIRPSNGGLKIMPTLSFHSGDKALL